MNQLVIEKDGQYLVSSFNFIKKYRPNIDQEHIDRLAEKSYLDYLDVIEIAMELSYKEPNKLNRNIDLIDMAETMMGDRNKMFTASSLRMMVSKNFLDSRPDEFDIYKLFKSEYKNILGQDYEIVNRKNNPKHIPDFWLMCNNEYIPVEIKLHEFKENHLRQLQRYIDFYKCSKGIAVAKNLKCSIPCNVKFITYKNMEVI